MYWITSDFINQIRNFHYMKEFIKKNFAILLAFVLPILLISGVALSTYIPSLFLSTHYNFIYSSCSDGNYYSYDYYCNNHLQRVYSVVDNKITINPIKSPEDLNKDGVINTNDNFTPHLFIHDTQTNESREITEKEAQMLTLNSLLTSPDGVNVSGDYNYNSGCGLFMFGGCGGSSFGYYLTKGNSKSRLNIINKDDRYYYQNNFQFLGWVMPGRN